MSSELGKMEVTKIIDNEDGSATVMFNMDWDAVRAFAKIGLMQVLVEAAQEMIEQEGSTTDEATTDEA
jgi:hypothetical protein